MGTEIKIAEVTKKYGDRTIIPDLSVTIKSGEFFTLLGPSGCGKTTLLRMIAGFNSIEAGSIYFDDKKINEIPPYLRNIGMVFQSYAIFPHMTVRKNVEYGLKQRKMDKKTIKEWSDNIMETVKITEYADRSPNQLSGGQQQRVALARAIVIRPSVLLMDEPLSNLDAKLRIEMRSAIHDVQKKVGITTVYVTHDQEEALAISDRIAVMNQGVIQQVGTPIELYHRPANVFVATFVGISTVFDAVCKYENNSRLIVIDDQLTIKLDNLSDQIADGQTLKVTVRPEEFIPVRDPDQANVLRGIVKSCIYLGKCLNYEVQLKNGHVIEISQPASGARDYFSEGDEISLTVDSERINVFDGEGSVNLIRKED